MAKKKKKASSKWGSARTPTEIPAGAQRGKRTKADPKNWHPEALAALRMNGKVEETIRVLGIGRTTFFDHYRQDAEFAREVDQIKAAHRMADASLLASKMLDRALNGEKRLTVEYDATGTETARSETTHYPFQRGKFLLEKLDPATYGPVPEVASETPSDNAEKLRDALAAMNNTVEAPAPKPKKKSTPRRSGKARQKGTKK